jgi:hypothetical protein
MIIAAVFEAFRQLYLMISYISNVNSFPKPLYRRRAALYPLIETGRR